MAMEGGAQPVITGAHAAPSSPERVPGLVLAEQIRRRVTIALLWANCTGAVLTFVLGNWVVPFPSEGSDAANIWANVIGFVVVLVLGLFVGRALSLRTAGSAQGWLKEDRPPTAEEREYTLRFPLRQTVTEAVLWFTAAIFFATINWFASPEL